MAAPSPAARSSAPSSLDLQLEVETPEQVTFSYTLAGLGSRAAAALVDGAMCAAIYAALLFLATIAVGGGAARVRGVGGSAWATTLVVLGQFAIFWGWYVLWEGLRDGQTPGKRWLGLRVVRDGGLGVDLAASAARNLVRVLDMQPGIFYGVGAVSVAVSSQGKRIGDYVAGTIVVRERTERRPAAAAPVAGAAALHTMLADDEYALLQRFRERRADLAPERAAELVAQLAGRFRPRVSDPSLQGLADAAFLARLHEHERDARARGVAARGTAGAGRAQHAIVAEGQARWDAFAALLADAERRGLARMREEEVTELVARYRELTTDLARLRTAARGRESDAAYHLSRLVAGGHNLLYRGRRIDRGLPWRYVTRTVPAELRRSWRPIALAAALFFVPAIAAFEATRRSEEATAQLVPRALIDRAETGAERARRGGGYLPERDAELQGALLSSLVGTNNVQITFGVFASGVTAGVGTVFLLVFNGVAAIGAPLGLYARLGLLEQILNFVLAHGVLELTAICVAGGAGFHVASAILLPGERTRREALVHRARRALALIAASTLLLVVAGLLEGYVSPLVWPTAWKAAISAVTAVALVGYWCLGMNRRTAPSS